MKTRRSPILTVFSNQGRARMVALLLMAAATAGCASNITSVVSDYRVDRDVASDRLPSSYHYYIYGDLQQAYILVGLLPGYTLSNTKWWEPVNTKRHPVSELADHIRNRYWGIGFFGFRILDTSGNTIGIYYSGHHDAWAEVDPVSRQVYIIADSPWKVEKFLRQKGGSPF